MSAHAAPIARHDDRLEPGRGNGPSAVRRLSAARAGAPLDEATRIAMERGFGHDFSAVRVHAGDGADQAARGLDARAFTVGNDVVLAQGASRPGTAAGFALLAHELAHVVQQDDRVPTGSAADDTGDLEADAAARTVAAGGRVQVHPRAVSGPQRTPAQPTAGAAVRTPALTPEEMWTQLVQSRRGFESSSSGPGDSSRSAPATVPPGSLRVDESGAPAVTGAPLGRGYETFAGVQVVDAEGNRVAVAADQFRGTGPDAHAEARCVRALETHGPARVPGGRLMVVSDQTICPTCRSRLLAYARSRGLTVIAPYEPVRARMVGTGDASPKTTSRSSTQAGRPQLTVVAREPIPVPATPTPGGAPPARPPAAPVARPDRQPSRSRTTDTPRAAAPAAPSAPSRESGVVSRGGISVTVESRLGSPRVRVTSVAPTDSAPDPAPQLSRTPKGAALATATTVAAVGRGLLDLYASTADEATGTVIRTVTHPLETLLRSRIAGAEREFLSTHPDPATLESRIDAARLRAGYEAEWRRLGAHRGRMVLMALNLFLVQEDRRGPEWYAALARLQSGIAAPPRDVESFREAALAYESRAIDVLQEIASYPLGLPQIAEEIGRRARTLSTISAELERVFWEAAQRFPLASTALLRLYSESQFIADLSGRMTAFQHVVESRYRAYVAIDRELSDQLIRIGEHIDEPGRALVQPPPRAR